MKKKWLLSGAFILLVAAGAGGWWLLSPLLHDDVVNEALPVPTEKESSIQTDEESESGMTTGEGTSSAMAGNEVADNGQSDPSAETANEVEMDAETAAFVKHEGSFQDGDSQHSASGRAYTLQSEETVYIRFEDFETTNGPDLFVYLVKEGQSTSEGLRLGSLKGNIGNQNYEIPGDVDVSEYAKVVIWCKAFDVDFGYAELVPQS
ncbi:DM13 domain-containing protein [Marinicrinis sediminis]|uniref:DM13 domain-containing protein n=1 Tax=Marinicrinis sediminis TaxID=1652465 RepID=A0ABW5RBL2_9BACL